MTVATQAFSAPHRDPEPATVLPRPTEALVLIPVSVDALTQSLPNGLWQPVVDSIRLSVGEPES